MSEDTFNPLIAPGALARAEARRTQEQTMGENPNLEHYLKRFDVNVAATGASHLSRWRAEVIAKAWLKLPPEVREKAHKRALAQVAQEVSATIVNSPVVKGQQRKRMSPVAVLVYLRKMEAVQASYVKYSNLTERTFYKRPRRSTATPKATVRDPKVPVLTPTGAIRPKDLALVATIAEDIQKLEMPGRLFLQAWLQSMVHTPKERR